MFTEGLSNFFVIIDRLLNRYPSDIQNAPKYILDTTPDILDKDKNWPKT